MRENKDNRSIIKSFKMLWRFMGPKERLTFVLILAFSWVSAITWMFFNLVPPLVLASLAGEPVKLLFVDMSALSTLAVIAILLGFNFFLWIVGMLHYYALDVFARKMICVVNTKAQDLVLTKRKNLDFGMTEGEVNYIIENASNCVYNLIEPVCWNIITNFLAVALNIAVLFSIDWVVGIVSIVMIGLIFLIVFVRLKIQKPIVEKIENTNAKIGNQSLSSIQNLPLITMLKSNLEERRQLNYLNRYFFKLHKKRAQVGFWYWIIIIAVEYAAIGLAAWLFIARNGTAQAIASVSMIFTMLGDIQATTENWGWEIGDIQECAVKLCNLEVLQPTSANIKEAVSKRNLMLYDENITRIHIEELKVRLGKFQKTYAADFEGGNIYLLSGKSGCGKTTFVNALCGLREVKYGQIYVNDKYKLSSLANFTDKISYMFQNSILFDRSIEKNIAYPLSTPNEEGKRLIKKFNMTRLINREQEGKNVRNSLSGGEKKRIDFIRALSRKADIYFLDEPTNELDAKNVDKVIQELERLKKQNKIVVVISHDNRIAEIADKVVEL